jgi:hypothetical protein
VILAGCGSSRSSIPTETFSNTVWQEVCAGAEHEAVYLRFLPDGTFAYSVTGLDPGDFQHDGDDRWGIVERTFVVTWDGGARTTQYREGESPDVYLGTSTGPCGREARLEHVE